MEQLISFINFLSLRTEQLLLDMEIRLDLEINNNCQHQEHMKLKEILRIKKGKDRLWDCRDKYFIFHVVNKIQQHIPDQT